MSIAVSANVQPSRILFAATAAMAAASACIGVALGFGAMGADLQSTVRIPLAAAVVFLAFFGFYHGVRGRKPIHIDISGTGQIRIIKRAADSPCRNTNRPHVEEMAELVRLADDTTIWSSMLLLRLVAANGEVTTIPVLPDSVSQDGFRALSVACRWISEQKDGSERETL